MKHLSSIVLTAAVLAAGTVACFKDPTSAARKGPTRLVLTRSSAFLTVGGDPLQVQAELKDEQGNTYDVADAAWSSANTAIASVAADTSQYIPYHALTRANIAAVSAGQTYVYIETHGLKDSVQVVGIPPTFTGAFTIPSGSMLTDTISIATMANVTFKTGTTVTIGGFEAWVLSQTPTALKIMAKKATTGSVPVVINDLTLIGTVNLASLTASTALSVADTVRYNEPANDARATAPVIDLTNTSAGHPLFVYGAMNANTDYWDYWTFTLAAPAAITGTITWFGDGSGSDNNHPDFDLIICGPAPVAACGYGNDLAGNAAAGTNMPETFTTGQLAAGQYYLRTFAYSTASYVVYQLAVNKQ